jgi:hypothetical protein
VKYLLVVGFKMKLRSLDVTHFKGLAREYAALKATFTNFTEHTDMHIFL